MSLPVYLIGARGCGKTTIGQILATVLTYTFSDTDSYLQQTVQKTVAEIVAAEGWEKFRGYESQSLIAVTEANRIIATGGGIVLAESNRQFMREQGHVIYLYADADVLSGRLAASPLAAQRPTLTGRPVVEEVSEILAQSDELYRQTAHHIVNAMQDPQQIIRHILNSLSLACAS